MEDTALPHYRPVGLSLQCGHAEYGVEDVATDSPTTLAFLRLQCGHAEYGVEDSGGYAA